MCIRRRRSATAPCPGSAFVGSAELRMLLPDRAGARESAEGGTAASIMLAMKSVVGVMGHVVALRYVINGGDAVGALAEAGDDVVKVNALWPKNGCQC